MDYKVNLKKMNLEISNPFENWKAVNNEYFVLSENGIIQPYEYVLNLLGKPSGLFYVDIGAHDGLSCSNSAYMEFLLGWDGICIEPHPELFSLLEESRSCKLYNCCISDVDEFMDFVVISGDGDALSGILSNMDDEHKKRYQEHVVKFGGGFEVKKIMSKTLNSILDENSVSKIDYLSIDTEGSEYKIITSIDYDRFDITVISAENNTGDSSVRDFLESKGYEYVTKCCSDEIFIKR
jgi:FkbM family methyltransferase